MKDQGQLLRDYIENYVRREQAEQENEPTQNTTKVISVTSGKGGVGKTNFTVNFAIELSKRGKKVLIIDADFGLSNIDVVLGILPKYDLSHVLTRQKSISEVITEGCNGVKFIAGGSGISDLFNLDTEDIQYFIEEIMTLENMVDIIIFDTGAGVNNNNMQMISTSDEVMVIVTTEPTSVIDAYALCKIINKQNSSQSIRLVVNRADSPKEAGRIVENFKRVSNIYLKTDIKEIGYILDDPNVSKSVKMQSPVTVSFPNSVASKNIAKIADAFLADSTTNNKSGLKSFFQKMLKL